LQADREAMQNEVGLGTQSSKDKLFAFVEQYLPALADSRMLDLNNDFMSELKKLRTDWAADPEIAVAAFYVGPGRDLREKGYVWRIALTVADVLAEFGAENTALFVRDEKIQGIVKAVLQRFGESDLQKTDSIRDLLFAALSATLNGALDAQEQLRGDDKWLGAILDSLVMARASVPKDQRDEFLVGLVRGEGYPALVSAAMETATKTIDDDGSASVDFKDVAADFLKSVGKIVKTKQDFKGFFQDHWGDLLRAGLTSIEKNGPALLGDQPLLGKVLTQVAANLAKQPNNRLLTADSLYGIVDGVAAAVAANPDQINKLIGPNKQWLSKLITSVSDTVADQGIRKTFSQEGVDTLLKDTFATLAEHPELLVKDNQLAGALVGGVLKQLSQVGVFNAQDLASATVSGALNGLAANPGLLDFRYSDLVTSLAGKVGTLVQQKKLSGVQGRDILEAVSGSLADNPELFLKLEGKLAESVVEIVANASEGRPAGLIAGRTLTRVVKEVMSALAQSGRAALKNHPAGDLVQQLAQVIDAGLTRGEKELGRRISVAELPDTLRLLVAQWANGALATLDPENENFKKQFAALADQAAA
jgi:hypothetical protein